MFTKLNRKNIAAIVMFVFVACSAESCSVSGGSHCPQGGSYQTTQNGAVCVVTTVVDGKSVNTVYAAVQTDAEKAQAESDRITKEAKAKVEDVKDCYKQTGMGTSCVADAK